MGVKIYLSDPSRGIFWVFQVGRGHSKTEVGGGAGFPTCYFRWGGGGLIFCYSRLIWWGVAEIGKNGGEWGGGSPNLDEKKRFCAKDTP